MENYEIHRDLFGLPQYVFPDLPAVLRLSYPGADAAPHDLALRPEVHRLPDRYRRLDQADFDEMYRDEQERFAKNPDRPDGITNVGQANYAAEVRRGLLGGNDAIRASYPPGLGVIVTPIA